MGTTRAPVEILERARRGGELAPAEIAALTGFWVDGIASDTQMAAWCASPAAEAAGPGIARAICRVLVASGKRLSPSSLGPTADKHSSGGVGDTTSLVAVPVAAALGATILKLSGEGREHFGGTLTKLAAVPGMHTGLDARGMLRAARDGGAVVAGGPESPAPAVARLEGLLGDIGGVGAPALHAAMAAARAIATGATGTVVHMTFGAGGAFGGRDAAVRGAEMAADLIAAAGGTARPCVSAVHHPLGPCVGNALELAAAAAVLRGEAMGDLGTAACALAGAMAEAGGVLADGEGATAAAEALGSGRALASAERWVAGQGADPAVWTDEERRAAAPLSIPVTADRDGFLSAIDPRSVGFTARMLGAGRLHPSQGVDYAVGVEMSAQVGDPVGNGEVLAHVHARDAGLGERAVSDVRDALRVTDAAPPQRSAAIEWLRVAHA